MFDNPGRLSSAKHQRAYLGAAAVGNHFDQNAGRNEITVPCPRPRPGGRFEPRGEKCGLTLPNGHENFHRWDPHRLSRLRYFAEPGFGQLEQIQINLSGRLEP
jgi:hypothetical protein